MNELRLAGGAAMCFSLCGIGLYAAYGVRKQTRQTEQLRDSLVLMQCEIDCGKTPLPELCRKLREACDSPMGSFYGALGRRIPKTGEKLNEAVEAALRDTPALVLPDEALSSFRQLLCGFGQYGSAEQLALLELTLRRLDTELSKLRASEASRVRCRAALGVSAGLSLLLLVI